jgi:hypothetical protein
MSRVSTGPVAAYDALVGWPRENEGRMKELIQQKWGIQVATTDLNQQTWGIQYGYSKSDRKGWKVLKLAFFLVFTTKICVFECKKGIQQKSSVQQLMVTRCAIQHGVESEFAFTRMEPWDSKPLNQWMINCLHDWNWETRVPKLAQNGFVYFGLGFCGILYTWTIYVPFDLQVWCIHVLAEYTLTYTVL